MMTTTLPRKKLSFIMRQSPHGAAFAQEALDILLMAASFDHEISLIFLSDGVFNLLKQQSATVAGNKNFTSAYKALALYDVNNVFVAKDDLATRGIKVDDLFLTPRLLSDDEIKELLHEQNAIFNF